VIQSEKNKRTLEMFVADLKEDYKGNKLLYAVMRNKKKTTQHTRQQ
jgi:hypothetical protein